MGHLFNLVLGNIVHGEYNGLSASMEGHKFENNDIILYKKNLNSVLCIGSDKKYISKEQIESIITAFSEFNSNYYLSKAIKVSYDQRQNIKERCLKIKDMLSEFLYTFLIDKTMSPPCEIELLENLKLKVFDENFSIQPNEIYYTLDVMNFKRGVQSDILRASPIVLPLKRNANGSYTFHYAGRISFKKRQAIFQLKNKVNLEAVWSNAKDIEVAEKIIVRTIRQVEWSNAYTSQQKELTELDKGALVVYLSGESEHEHNSGLLESKYGKVCHKSLKAIKHLQSVVEVRPLHSKKYKQDEQKQEEQANNEWIENLIKQL